MADQSICGLFGAPSQQPNKTNKNDYHSKERKKKGKRKKDILQTSIIEDLNNVKGSAVDDEPLNNVNDASTQRKPLKKNMLHQYNDFAESLNKNNITTQLHTKNNRNAKKNNKNGLPVNISVKSTTENDKNNLYKSNNISFLKSTNINQLDNNIRVKDSIGVLNKEKVDKFEVSEVLGKESLPDQLPSEPQEGNIEYKLKLLNPNQERLKRLVSQMQWRLREGLGEAIYEIGVEDSGLLLGLTENELKMSMDTLRSMATQLGASLTIIREKTIGDDKKVAEVLVRKVPDDQYSIELRIAVLGSSDVGKSTLLGVLTRGVLDNGKGCARLNVFRHRHEVYSGKTSSISVQTMGFDANGNVIDGTCTRSRDYDDVDICSQSSKIVNFIDLAGDQRYLHTTAFGLSGYCPHYALLVVNAFSGLSAMSTEHLSLARALDLPLIMVVTKTDLSTSIQLQNTLSSLKSVLTAPPYKKVPLIIESSDDAITAGSRNDSSVVPIFLVSSVTGDGLSLLKKFLFVLPPKMTAKEREKSEQQVTEFQIDEVFHIDDRLIVGGLLSSGVLPQSSSLLLGPFDDCTFKKISVESIHRNKVPCKVVCAGQSSSLCLRGESEDLHAIRKGMKLLAPEIRPKATYFFTARVKELRGSLSVGSQLTAHIGNVRQTVVVEGIYNSTRTDNADTKPKYTMLRFLRQPEYVNKDARILLRQGNIVGVGQVMRVFQQSPHFYLKPR